MQNSIQNLSRTQGTRLEYCCESVYTFERIKFPQEEAMIDIKFLRENPDIVKQNIKNKFQDHKLGLVDEVIELDASSRTVQQEADDLRAI